MTLFQETASARTLGQSERAFSAQLLAITAGLVVVLMAVAVTSYVAGRPADATIQSNADEAALIERKAASVPPRTISAAGGQEAISQQFVLQEAAVDGYTLRSPMQPQEASGNGYNQRFVHAE